MLKIPSVPLSDTTWQALQFARRCGRLVGGMERIASSLRVQTLNPKARVQRLILFTNDGSERFYRALERLLAEHQSTAMALQVQVDSNEVAQVLFGSSRSVKVLMMTNRETLERVLKSLLVSA